MTKENEKLIKSEWMANQSIVLADIDLPRLEKMRDMLSSVGFPREQILFAYNGDDALKIIQESESAILFIDDSIGVEHFKKIHTSMKNKFGALGFFLFAITEGKNREFVKLSASVHIDGILFRPYRDTEFTLRITEAFRVKWENRIVNPGMASPDLLYIPGGNDPDAFKKAIDIEKRLGKRSVLTVDKQVAMRLGLADVDQPGLTAGKKSFEKVKLSFKATSRNGNPLEKAFSIHPMEIDDARATFECSSSIWEVGDHISIEADIVHGNEGHLLRIEGKVVGIADAGFINVEFNEGNRTRFEAAMQMVAKRFKELKEFFKYAKGA